MRSIDEKDPAPVSMADASEFKALIEHVLPNDYREFLALCGDGYVGKVLSFN